jgi:hypothetical protein
MEYDPVITRAVRGLAGIAKAIGATKLLPGVACDVAAYVVPALAVTADLLEAGIEPRGMIERWRDTCPELRKLGSWETVLDDWISPRLDLTSLDEDSVAEVRLRQR